MSDNYYDPDFDHAEFLADRPDDLYGDEDYDADTDPMVELGTMIYGVKGLEADDRYSKRQRDNALESILRAAEDIRDREVGFDVEQRVREANVPTNSFRAASIRAMGRGKESEKDEWLQVLRKGAETDPVQPKNRQQAVKDWLAERLKEGN